MHWHEASRAQSMSVHVSLSLSFQPEVRQCTCFSYLVSLDGFRRQKPYIGVHQEYLSRFWCDFDPASSLICGNKMPTRCNRGFYCRSYCLLNMFRASLCHAVLCVMRYISISLSFDFKFRSKRREIWLGNQEKKSSWEDIGGHGGQW